MIFEVLDPEIGYHFRPCWHSIPVVILSVKIAMRKHPVKRKTFESESFIKDCVFLGRCLERHATFRIWANRLLIFV